MGLIYAELELVSTEDMALERKGYIKKADIKREIVTALVPKLQTIDVNPESKYMAKKKIK